MKIALITAALNSVVVGISIAFGGNPAVFATAWSMTTVVLVAGALLAPKEFVPPSDEELSNQFG